MTLGGYRGIVTKRLVDPFLVAAFFAVIGLLAYFLSMPERWAAVMVLVFFAAITAANPVNGAVFLFLAAPFYLGESGWPGYWMTEVFVFITIASAVFHTARLKDAPPFPLGRVFVFLLAASAASVPIDGREFLYEAWAASARDFFAWWLAAHPEPTVHYLRVLTNTASGAGIFYLAYALSAAGGAGPVRRLFEAVTCVAGAVCVAGILMVHGLVPKEQETWRYLTMSLVGSFGGSITAFAFALHFFNQYLLLVLPAALYVMFDRRRQPVSLAAASAAFGLATYCVIQGGLRTSAALLYLTLIFAAGLYIHHAAGRARAGKVCAAALILVAAAAGGYALMGGLAFQRLYGEILSRVDIELFENIGDFAGDPLYFMKHGISEPRFFLWHTAILMFLSSPLLGVGLGRYTALFKEYYASDWFNWEYIGFASGATAHSTYFEILANQGVIGLAAWGLLTGSVLAGGFRALKNQDSKTQEKALIIALLASLVIFLLMGVTHHLFLNRAIEIFFWVLLGLLAGLSADYLKKPDMNSKTFAAVMAFVAAAFLWQVKLVADRPIDEGYSTGFYNWERQPGGGGARWTGERAVMKIGPGEGRLVLPMSAPIPGLDERPRKAVLWLDGRRTEAVFGDTAWQDVVIFEGRLAEGGMLWIETDGVYNPKEAGASSDDRDLGVMVGRPRWEPPSD